MKKPRVIFLTALLISLDALAATPPVPTSADEPDLSILDMPPSEEERMVTQGDSPSTPETGRENPEDLLRSAPAVSSAKAEELPPPAEEEVAAEEAPPIETLPEVVVPPEPEVVAIEESRMEPEGESVKRFDRSIPPSERENPTVGIDIHASLQAFGTPIRSEQMVNGVGTGIINESQVNNFGIGFEYEPEFLQSLGVFSIGPSVNMYFLDPIGDLTDGAFSILSVGGSLKYQLRFMRSQILVPFAGFEAQMIRYSFLEETGLGTGWTTSSGPTLGAMLLLNWMEPSSAHNLFSEYGIKRSYLVGEAKYLTADNALFTTNGTAIYFGLRMEY